jgi:RNA polymerase sigma-70 factor (ECF subfamily)
MTRVLDASSPRDTNHARLRDLFHQHVRFVRRVLRRAGVPRADLDDEVQRTFMAFARRLDDVRYGAERSFLFNVAQNVALHARRSFARRREIPVGVLRDADEDEGTPIELIAREQARNLLEELLSALDESLRSVLVLHELYGMELFQIAQLLGIPRGTVASRLQRARKNLRRRIAAGERRPVSQAQRVEALPRKKEPTLLWRQSMTAFEYALLDVGRQVETSATVRAATLASLRRTD